MRKAMLTIDMPDTCGKCQLCQGVAMDGNYMCSIFDEYGNERGYDDGKYGKPDWCPLQLVEEDNCSLSEVLKNYTLVQCKFTDEELEKILDIWNSIGCTSFQFVSDDN